MEHAKLVCVGNGIYFEIWDRFMFPTFLRCGLVHVDPSAHFVGPPLLDTPYCCMVHALAGWDESTPCTFQGEGLCAGCVTLATCLQFLLRPLSPNPAVVAALLPRSLFRISLFFMMQVPCICWIDTVVTCCLLACAAMDPRESCRYTSTNRCTACPSTKGVSVD